MKRIITTLSLTFLIFLSFESFAQFHFNCKIDNYPNGSIVFCSQFGDKSKIIKNLHCDEEGRFHLSLDSLEFGLYRIYLSDDSSFDIIFNNENINIETNVDNLVNAIDVIESEENKHFYNFLKANYINDYKIEILEKFIEIYPQGDLLSEAKDEYKQVIKAKQNNIVKTIKINSNSFFAKYITCYEEYNIDDIISINDKAKYIKENYWKDKILNDTLMLNSDMYNEYIIYYIKLRAQNSTQINYYTIAKEVLAKFENGDKKIFNFALDYILSGYESMGLINEIEMLSNDYFNGCENEEDESTLATRLKYYNDFKIGNEAPAFSAKTIDGNIINFSKPLAKKTLLIFWASWCDHCRNMLPLIEKQKDIFDKNNIEIIAISLDKDKNTLLNFLNENDFSFDIICDFMSWDNDIVINYSIFGTPTMILIDENLKIIAKPYDESQLFRILAN